MSCGIVVCSLCRREIHQTGTPQNPQWEWTHCDDGTPQCPHGERDWARAGEPKGKWCGRDDMRGMTAR